MLFVSTNREGGMHMSAEIGLRHIEKAYLFQILVAQHRAKSPADFKDLIAYTKAKMEPEDVKLVQKDFDDWKNS
jgi:hypothetical protein